MAISFRTELQSAATPQAALSNAFTKAAATAQRTLQPYNETGIYAGKGPNALMGEVVIARDTTAADFTGANRLVFTGTAAWKSNCCLTIDSGVCLVYAIPTDSQLFNWDNNLVNVMLRTGDTTRGTGFQAGRWYYDGDTGVSFANVARRRLINFGDVQYWTVENLASRQPLGGAGSVTSGSAVFPFHGDTEATSARDGIMRFHYNTHSPSGYGPNQVASAFRVTFSDIDTEGGTALRFETDGSACGVHNIIGRRISGRNGNRVVSFSPHHVNSDHVDIRILDGESMFDGIRAAGNPEPPPNGLFTTTVVADGCFSKGTTAQDPAVGGAVGNNASHQVISDTSDPGADITYSDIGYSGGFTTANRGGPAGSYDTTKTCPRTIGGGGSGGGTNVDSPVIVQQQPADVVTVKLVTVVAQITDAEGIAWAKARKASDAPGVFIDMVQSTTDLSLWSCQMTLDGTAGQDISNNIRVDAQDAHGTAPRSTTGNIRTVVVRLPLGGGGGGGGVEPPIDTTPIPGIGRGGLERSGGPQSYEVPPRDALTDLQQRMGQVERQTRSLVTNPNPAMPAYDELPRDLSDGQFMIDKTDNSLVYIVNGTVYRLPGTPD